MESLTSLAPVLDCPSRAALMDFDLGRLSEPDFDLVALHLSSCSRCETVLSELQDQATDDRLIDGIKRCWAKTMHSEEPGCVAMIAHARMAGTDTSLLLDDDTALAQAGNLADDVAGRVIGPYELRCRIGRGGMGVVYKARHGSLGRMDAVKMILGGRHAGDRAIARFVREGRALARLKHRNVVQVYDFDEHEGLPYYAMELIEGGSLQTLLAQGAIEPREAATLVRELALAVDYLHGAGVLHRDLKPANILLENDGTPKIADFGLAKLLDSNSDEPPVSTLTMSGMVLGTAAYMAPEQVDGRSDKIGIATDIYALGAILYECLTGQPPFAASSKVRIFDLVRMKEAVPPSRLRPGISTGLEAICLKCLEKLPSRRYTSAQALADDLGRWLRDERPKETPGWLDRAARSMRRYTAVLVAVGMLGSVLVAVGAAWKLNDPERALRTIESNLALGHAVTLVGPTGQPRWSHWIAGKPPRSHATLADDGTLNVQSWSLALLELVPDTQRARYRFAAQVRHEKSDLPGGVGLYFGRKAHHGDQVDVQFFTQLTFNAVRGDADFRARVPINFGRIPLRKFPVNLSPRLYAQKEVGMSINRSYGGVDGPGIEPLGENNGRWHDLEVTVTPELVTARYNGQSFTATPLDLEREVHQELTASPPKPGSPMPRGVLPPLETRGGLGLYLLQGSASFRSISVTPLPEAILEHPQ